MLRRQFPYRPASAYGGSEGNATRRPSVRIVSRFDLTEPFHQGDQYAHFGVHYGATVGMCLTGVSHKDGYALAKCVRRAFVDGMLQQQWTAAIDAHYG